MPVVFTAYGVVTPLGTQGTPYATSEPWRSGNTTPMPPWKGTGTLSGTPPYIVTYGGSPAAVTLDLFDRATNIYIKSTTSDPVTGAWSFTGLSTTRAFDVRGRGTDFSPDENDLMRANQVPS